MAARLGMVAVIWVVAAIAVSVALASRGDGDASDARPNPPAARIERRVILSGNIPRVRPADYRRPTARYLAHVRHRLSAMRGDVRSLRAATGRDDMAAARAAWTAADSQYETIGAAYGAFGDLDAAINGRPDGLPGGVRSPDFTGLHRIEYALWHTRSTREAAPYAGRLERDVARLQRSLGRAEIDPLEYSLRAHEVLEDTLHLQLSGRASPWSGSALVALRSNVVGTGVVLETVRSLVARRNARVLQRVDRSLADLRAALRQVERPDGSMPRWDALGQRDRTLVAGRTGAAAEELAYIPEYIDPRPARPVQRQFGTEEGTR